MTAPTQIAYPAFYRAASLASKQGQDRYMHAIRVRLVALVVSAVGGAISWKLGTVEPFAWLALGGFVVALAAEVVILALQPDQRWYEGRAAAESAKTLSWRYAVAGDPFPTGVADPDRAFHQSLSEVMRDLTVMPVPDTGDDSQITAEMRALRAQPFADRRASYLAGRIKNQQTWYTDKARGAERRNTGYLLATIALEFVGIVAATLRVAGAIDFDLLGILAAVVGGIASWAQTRQYGSLGRAYSIAAHELSSIAAELATVTEANWPRFVDESEEAISREHTLWRASRGVPGRSPSGSAPAAGGPDAGGPAG